MNTRSQDSFAPVTDEPYIGRVWTKDYDGRVRKSRIKKCADRYMLKDWIGKWVEVFQDGTSSTSLPIEWWPR